jgi:hypothetical protein
MARDQVKMVLLAYLPFVDESVITAGVIGLLNELEATDAHKPAECIAGTTSGNLEGNSSLIDLKMEPSEGTSLPYFADFKTPTFRLPMNRLS